MHIFVDESGDLGEKGSAYFVLMLLATRDVKSVERALRRTRRRKFRSKQRPEELKGVKMSPGILRYFYRQMEDVPFELAAVVLDKPRLAFRHKDDRRIYALLLCEGIEAFPRISFPLRIYVDRRFSHTEFQIIEAYVEGYLRGRTGNRLEVDIHQMDSRISPGIQAVDLFSRGVFEKYAFGEEGWYAVFSERIVSEKVVGRISGRA